MTMRRYLWSGALLYLVIGALLIGAHTPLHLRVFEVPFSDQVHVWIGAACLLLAGVKGYAGWKLTPVWQIAAISFGVGMATLLTVETAIEASFDDGGWTVVTLWAYLAVLTRAVLPYAIYGKRELEEIRRLIASISQAHESAQQTNSEIENRLKDGDEP